MLISWRQIEYIGLRWLIVLSGRDGLSTRSTCDCEIYLHIFSCELRCVHTGQKCLKMSNCIIILLYTVVSIIFSSLYEAWNHQISAKSGKIFRGYQLATSLYIWIHFWLSFLHLAFTAKSEKENLKKLESTGGNFFRSICLTKHLWAVTEIRNLIALGLIFFPNVKLAFSNNNIDWSLSSRFVCIDIRAKCFS